MSDKRQLTDELLSEYERLAINEANLSRDYLTKEREVKVLAHAAITKLVGGTNPLTNKPHSFASAEIAFKGGEEYSALKRELFALMHARDLAAIEARCSYLRLLAGWESTWVRAMAAKQAPPTPDA